MPPRRESRRARSGEAPEEDAGAEDDRLEMPGQPYAFALWNLIIRPPRRRYDFSRLGPTEFRLWSCGVQRMDITIRNGRDQQLRCSHFLPVDGPGEAAEPRPVVIYLHQNASCRLEALPLVPLFLPLGISVFSFDFAGCGESDGEYISLGWFERDDLATIVEYLRSTGKVSAIGLWGRSMGAVTALLHADRDPSIGGMVLDSPFCNLRQLAAELAQSEYLTVKVPNWLLSGALAMGRLRIKSLCGFDIDQLAPERHVGNSFIPAFFIHGNNDDFIAPRHTEVLYQAYTGDKELAMVTGDHNTPREHSVNRKAVLFFCRAFRCSPVPQRVMDGNLAALLGFDAQELDAAYDHRVVGRLGLQQAARLLAEAGSGKQKPSMGQRLKAAFPFRAECSLQLNDTDAQAGFCAALLPLPSEWAGVNRPPTVLFALVSVSSIQVLRAVEGREPEIVAEAPCQLQPEVPVLCIFQLLVQKAQYRLRFALAARGPELEIALGEEYDSEVVLQSVSRGGEATFFDVALIDLEPPEVDEAGRKDNGGRQDNGGSDSNSSTSAQSAATPVATPTATPPIAAAPKSRSGSSRSGDQASGSGGGFCNQQ